MRKYISMGEIYHHGIKGQKWGVRRFQTKSGTLTPAGRKRYAGNSTDSMSDEELRSKVQRLNLEKQYNKMTKENSSPSKLEKTKKVVDASANAVNQLKSANKSSKSKSKMDLSDMTDQQLRERINRANLEKQYNDLFNKESENVSKGKKYVDKILDATGTLLGIGSSSLAIALAIKELKSKT